MAAVAGLPPGWQAPTTFHAAQSVAQTLHGRSPAADPTGCERRLAAARSKLTAGTEPRACAGCCEVTLTKYRRQGPEVCQVSAATRRSTGTEAMDYTMVSECLGCKIDAAAVRSPLCWTPEHAATSLTLQSPVAGLAGWRGYRSSLCWPARWWYGVSQEVVTRPVIIDYPLGTHDSTRLLPCGHHTDVDTPVKQPGARDNSTAPAVVPAFSVIKPSSLHASL